MQTRVVNRREDEEHVQTTFWGSWRLGRPPRHIVHDTEFSEYTQLVGNRFLWACIVTGGLALINIQIKRNATTVGDNIEDESGMGCQKLCLTWFGR